MHTRPGCQLTAYLSGDLDASELSEAVYSWSEFAVYKMACTALSSSDIKAALAKQPDHLRERITTEARRIYRYRRESRRAG